MSFAVGSLVKARDREWVVLPESEKEVLMLRPLGGRAEEITGICPSLENIEQASFELPDPKETGDHRSCKLLRDAVRLGFRESSGPFRCFGHIAVEPRPYQLVPLLLLVSILTFLIIELPPGDYLTTYIIRRLLQGLVVLLAVTMICFIIFRYMGDPVQTLAGRYATQKDREEVREAFGLDKPIYVQYGHFLWNALHGNFGKSYVSRVPTLKLILERFPATFELAATAVLLAFTIGLSLGVLVSLKPYAFSNRLIMATSLGGISIPTFLIGILLIMIFAVFLGILPPYGRGETVQVGFWRTGLLTLDGLKHLILPAITLAMYQLAVILRLTRAGMREVLAQEYIKTAKAKGLPPYKVVIKHALRNVMIPVVTITGLQFGEILAFAIVTETIFQWPGMGNLLLTSIYESDQPVIATYIMLAAVIILTINIIVDVIYALLNPKIRYD